MKKTKKSKRLDGKVRNAIKRKSKQARRKQKKEKKKLKMMGRKKLSKTLDIPNLWPWKEEMLKQRLERQKDIDADEEERRRLHRKRQLKAKREKMLLNAVTGKAELKQKEREEENKGKTKNKNWYRKDLLKVIEQSDVIVEVLDARDPLACRCKEVEDKILSLQSNVTTRNKKLILLINKIDLVPSEVLVQWIRLLRQEFPVIAFKCNTQNQKYNLMQSSQSFTDSAKSMSQSVGVDALMSLLKNYCRSFKLKTSLTIGFIGYPNTGKSSVINSLKRTRSVGTSSRPGFTTNLQEVKLDGNIKLIDSPGVLLNRHDDPTSLVLKNAITVDQVDGMTAVSGILNRCNKESLMEVYEIPEFTNVEEFLFLVGKNRGKLKKGGVPDIEQAARAVLQDWNSGKIPFYVSPPARDESEETQIVNHFSEAFDIEALLNENYNRAIQHGVRGKFVAMRTEDDDVEMN